MKQGLLKKLVSVFLAFSILNANVFALDFNYKEFYLLRNEISKAIKPITETDIRAKYLKEYNFKALFQSINDQGFNNNYGKVCDGETCAPYHTFMRGLIGALIDFSEGDGTILINYTREIRNAVFMGALASRDIKPLRKLLKDGVKETVSSCGSNPFFEGVEDTANTVIENLYIKKRDFSADQKAQDNCEKGLAGLSILSVVWENKQQADETADLIHKTLNKHYKGKFSSLVLLEGVAALSFIDTDYSYQLIEEFLTKDSIPNRVGTAVLDAMSMFLPQGIYDAGEKEIEEKYNNATRYLNRINARWQYIDEDATARRGIDPSIFSSANSVLGQFDDNYIRAAYNVVQNNTLTDIGAFLAAQGERGQKLAKKIVHKYASATPKERERMHTPLILGLIQNLEFAYALRAARIINESFYYDIGGGAGSLIAQKSAIKSSGLNKRAQNTISEKYYLDRAKVGRVNFILGLFIQVLSMGFLALSITNTVANIYRLASFRSLKFTVNMGANAGKTTQISQVSKTAQSLPKPKPELPQPNTAVAALPQSKAVTALPQVKEIPALQQPKVPVVESLSVPNVLSKIRTKNKGILQPTSNIGGVDSLSQKGSLNILSDGLNKATQSVFRIFPINGKGAGSGFLTEIPLFGQNQQVIVTAGHVVDLPNEGFYLSNKNKTTVIAHPTKYFAGLIKADLLFYVHSLMIKGTGIYEDYALLLPREHIDAPSLPLIFDNKFSNFREFTSMGFPGGKFVSKNFKLTPGTKELAGTPNIKYLGGKVNPGNSGGPVFVETAPNEYSVIGTVVATLNNGRYYTLVHTLGWLKKFIETGVTRPKFLNIDLSKKAFFNIFDKARRRGNITPTIDKASEEFNFPAKTSTDNPGEQKFSNYSFRADWGVVPGTNLEGAKNLREVTSAELLPYDESVHHTRAVWKLKNKDGNILFYLKYGTAEEIARMELLDEVVSKSDLIKNNPLVRINYPQIVAEGDIPLPAAIKNQIENELRQIKPGLWGIGRGKVPFVMTVLRADGFKYDDLNEPGGRTLAMHKLHKKPITFAEWEEIEKIFNELNKNGVVHPDLPRNFEFARDDNDILNNDIYDLENGPKKVENNKEDLQDLSERFEKYGIKESDKPNSGINSQYIGSQYWF